MNNGVITIATHKEIYYHWSEVLFKSILQHTNIDFALVYDNEEWYQKYNLNTLIKYPIYRKDIDNPYLYKYKLIEVTPFDNTIFFDADTIIFKDISDLFEKQAFSVCSEWDEKYLYNDFSFVQNPKEIVDTYKLKKLYSIYSGFLRFEKTDFYKKLYKNVLKNEHHNDKIFKQYNRGVMPDEFFLNITTSDLELKRFIPIQLYYIEGIIDNTYGYSFQGNPKIKHPQIMKEIKKTISSLNINIHIYNEIIKYESKLF